MFGFLFKRSGRAKPPVHENQKRAVKDEVVDLGAEKAGAIAAAQGFAGNETAAAEFVLQCKIADARLEAAHHVHSKELLAKLVHAMRETDRRVARLAQQRLDAIKKQEITAREAAVCIDKIQSLVNEPVILSNQVSEIERSWAALHDVPQHLTAQFEQSRSTLQQRLLAQTALQRTVIELRNGVQSLISALRNASPSERMDEVNARLAVLSGQFAGYCTSPEAPSLPKNLLSDVESGLADARQLADRLVQRQAAIAAHEQAYAAWEADASAEPDIQVMRRELRSLPALDTEDAHLFEQRLECLQARHAKSKPPSDIETTSLPVAKADPSQYRPILEAMEHALEDGSLQLASEHEKALRSADAMGPKWKEEDAARLAKARAELSRLKGWARWGGQVSRAELVKAAEELPAKENNPSELAKKIGSLRSQWKSMDATAGIADKDSWLKFDAACTAAYAPVTAHFHALSAERKANQEKAQLLVSQIDEFAAKEISANEKEAIDWKKVSAFRAHMSRAWHEIGTVDRKAKKALDKQYLDAMRTLSEPLSLAQQEEIKRRENLIEQALGLELSGKKAMDALRQLQQQWQQQAKSLPLERRDEQHLWQRFRAACDVHAARRKADMEQSEAQHSQNFRLKSALCERLESETVSSTENLGHALKHAEQEWNAIGPVGRANEHALNERYQRAAAVLSKALVDAKRVALSRQFEQLYKKIKLCMAVDEAILAGAEKNIPKLEDAWRGGDAIPRKFESALEMRFHTALTALQSADAQYAARLRANRTELERELLRLEIKLEIESPPELAAERLKLQVEALQASLKSGNQAGADDAIALLIKICALPALHDDASRTRIERAINRLAAGTE
jgi:DNA repair protein SbcC/Rad50